MVVQIAVCGPSECDSTTREQAFEVGRLLAAEGVTVLCGGYGGVMAAAAAGARSLGGLVVGILSASHRMGASEDLSAVIATGMGQARNYVLVRSADAVVIVGGSWGTLSELALAMRSDVPVVSIGGWKIADSSGAAIAGVYEADNAAQAIAVLGRQLGGALGPARPG